MVLNHKKTMKRQRPLGEEAFTDSGDGWRSAAILWHQIRNKCRKTTFSPSWDVAAVPESVINPG